MKFRFKIQQYQSDAVNSVVSVFDGQPFCDRVRYVRDLGEQQPQPTTEAEQLSFLDQLPDGDENAAGFQNAGLQLSAEQLLMNIRGLQSRSNIRQSEALYTELGACSLDVEMETGTGKTYVYIKTIFELNKRYGWSKFIVVVPSIAIREGVKKSFEITEDHFMEHYGKKARFFVYNSKSLSDLDNFSSNAGISVMIINMQAFNARGADARRIREELDDFGSRRPIDVIAANRPILILDEPQKMGGVATQASLKEFKPLFTLNYSATHKEHHNPVYVLDAVDAFNKRLVKRIEVKGFELRNLRGTNRYLYLENIIVSPTKAPRAKIELEIWYKSGMKREPRILEVGDKLYDASHLEQYKGYTISEIDPLRGVVYFTNGEQLQRGEVSGDVSESDLRRVQIRETILSHFEKEKRLFALGIKTLSLFFIDEVAKYRAYDEEGNEINGEYGRMFEEEYTRVCNEYLTLLTDDPYQRYLREISADETHAGYFSIDKKGRKVNSATRRGSDESDDISAYDLILKNKELLLGFGSHVRFIFSHSALREGWDNPNVFQICTLKHGGTSATQKRQEVGRGLRLCVDQRGERMDAEYCGETVHSLNMLTVVASEGYSGFVSGLQTGIREALYDRPPKATIEYFIGKTIMVSGQPVVIDMRQARDIYRYLLRNDYIDDEDGITPAYRADIQNGTLAALPESLQPMADGVHALVQSIFDPSVLRDMIGNGNDTTLPENALNDNFYRKEFQLLWGYINHKYAYTVQFDSAELIEKAIANINAKLRITRLQYTVTAGVQTGNMDANALQRGDGFEETRMLTRALDSGAPSQVRYDLIGKIAEGAVLTRRTAATILSGIEPQVFAMFRQSPEEFITKVIKLIKEEKATLIVEHIQYDQIDGEYDSSIFTAERGSAAFANAYRAKKSIQDYVFIDGIAERCTERRFAEALDHADEVCVYAKLPRGFSIPTPLGNYSPDWAIAFNEGTVKHIFFVAETKGSMDSADFRKIEGCKIDCAKRLFASISSGKVKYDVVDDYQHLLDIVRAV